MKSFSYCHEPQVHAVFKQIPDDFIVTEKLSFSPCGEGEHLFLLIEKKEVNTERVQRDLARLLNKPKKLVSYAGLKDRQAIARQWFSIHCPGEAIDEPESLCGEGWKVLEAVRHNKKLKTGALSGNHFSIVLRDLTQQEPVETALLRIQQAGVPNYFGEQRFGHQGQNVERGRAMVLGQAKVKDRFLKGIYLSALRSWLFNLILSERVQQSNWNQAVTGDVLQLHGSKSIFAIEQVDEEIERRIKDRDLFPAAVLWGKGDEKGSGQALDIQQQVLANESELCEALEKQGLERAWRAMVLIPEELQWEWAEPQQLRLSFSLPSGAYATALLRELVRTH